jgi:hypothetical protein
VPDLCERDVEAAISIEIADRRIERVAMRTERQLIRTRKARIGLRSFLEPLRILPMPDRVAIESELRRFVGPDPFRWRGASRRPQSIRAASVVELEEFNGLHAFGVWNAQQTRDHHAVGWAAAEIGEWCAACGVW